MEIASYMMAVVHVISFVVMSAILAREAGRSGRIGAADREVGAILDSGPVAISRNPVFLGQALLFVGLFVVLRSLIQPELTGALLLAMALQVRIEERVLCRMPGEPDRDYCRRVRRGLGSYPHHPEGTP